MHIGTSSPRGYLAHKNQYRMDIEAAEDVAQEYGITAVPTFLLFKDGDILPEKSVLGPHHMQASSPRVLEMQKCLD